MEKLGIIVLVQSFIFSYHLELTSSLDILFQTTCSIPVPAVRTGTVLALVTVDKIPYPGKLQVQVQYKYCTSTVRVPYQ